MERGAEHSDHRDTSPPQDHVLVVRGYRIRQRLVELLARSWRAKDRR